MADEALSTRDALRRVGVLIVNYNAGPWLKRGLERLLAGPGESLQVVIVDNGSTDDSLDGLPTGKVTIDRAGANLGFGPGMNRVAGVELEDALADGEVLDEPPDLDERRHATSARSARIQATSWPGSTSVIGRRCPTHASSLCRQRLA